MSIPITVLIAVRNEEVNLSRCLRSVKCMQHVVVIDSNSTDDTCRIAEEAGAELVQFKYAGGYPKKRQWGLENLRIATPWVLMLDADEVVSEDLIHEIKRVVSDPICCDGYLIRKGFHFLGNRFRFGGFSHKAVLLFRTGQAKFEHLMDENPGGMDMEVHERLIVQGPVGTLSAALIHEDFKGLEAYIARHNQYSTWEAALRHGFLTTGQWGKESITARLWGNAQERRRFLKQLVCRLPLVHWVWFIYHFIIRGGMFEGACRLDRLSTASTLHCVRPSETRRTPQIRSLGALIFH